MASLLSRFQAPVDALVIGASGGIGGAFTTALATDPMVGKLYAASRRSLNLSDRVTPLLLDITDEASIVRALTGIDRLDLVIVASGFLHDERQQPEKTWRSLDAAALTRSFQLNAIGPILVAKHTLPLLPRDRRSVFAALSARVGSIGDNRLGGWYGYRAAKAALNQLLRTAAIELAQKRPHALCVGLHPGTVVTPLSAPFRGHVPEGKLFSPKEAAERLLGVIDGLMPADSGGVFAWDGTPISP